MATIRNEIDKILQAAASRFTSSDSILTPQAKPLAVQEYSVILAEQAGIDGVATTYGISHSTYDTAITALTTYLGTLTGWNVIPGPDVIYVGTTFRAKFADVHVARQAIINACTGGAKTLADAAQATADAATLEIAAISSNNVLSAGEKPAIVLDYTAITAEQSGIDAQADSFGQSRSTYDIAVAALTSHLTGLSPAYNNYATDTVIVGTTFQSKFTDVYAARQALLNSIYNKGKTLTATAQAAADAAQITANTAITNAATAQTAANTANTAIAAISSDNVLSAGEKPAVVLDYTAITAEQSGIDSQADTFGQSRTAYDAAVSALTTYVTGLSPAYNSYTTDTVIVGATFRAKFADVYAARQTLLNAIATHAKDLADTATFYANNVTTAQIVPNAATDSVSVTSTPVVVASRGLTSAPSSNSDYTTLTSYTFTPAVSGAVVVHFACSIKYVTSGGGPFAVDLAYIKVDAGGTYSSADDTKATYDSNSTAGAANFVGTKRLTVTAGASTTIYFRGSVATAGAITSTASEIQIYIEVIKR